MSTTATPHSQSPASQIFYTTTQLFIPLAAPFQPHSTPTHSSNNTTTINTASSIPQPDTIQYSTQFTPQHEYPLGTGLSQLAPLYRVLRLLSHLQQNDNGHFQQVLRVPTFAIEPQISSTLLSHTPPPQIPTLATNINDTINMAEMNHPDVINGMSSTQQQLYYKLIQMWHNHHQFIVQMQAGGGLADSQLAEAQDQLNKYEIEYDLVKKEFNSVSIFQTRLITNALLQSSSSLSSWVYNDIPVNMFAQLERVYIPYDNILDTQQKKALQKRFNVRVWADIPVNTSLLSPSFGDVISSHHQNPHHHHDHHHHLHHPYHHQQQQLAQQQQQQQKQSHTIANDSESTTIPQTIQMDGDMIFPQLFQHEKRLIDAIDRLIQYHHKSYQQRQLDRDNARVERNQNDEMGSAPDTLIPDKNDAFLYQQYKEKLLQLRTFISYQMDYLTRLVHAPDRSAMYTRDPTDVDDNDINNKMNEGDDEDNNNNNNNTNSNINQQHDGDHDGDHDDDYDMMKNQLTISNTKYLNYLHSIFTSRTSTSIPTTPHNGITPSHLSLAIINQLHDLQHILSPHDTFVSPAIPTSVLSTPQLQFFYKANSHSVSNNNNNTTFSTNTTGQSHNNANTTTITHQQPVSHSTSIINDNVGSNIKSNANNNANTNQSQNIPSHFTTQQIVQVAVPSSSNAAFINATTSANGTSNQITRLDNQLRYFGFTFDYQYVTFGFTFQLTHTIEVRVFKLCHVMVDKPNISEMQQHYNQIQQRLLQDLPLPPQQRRRVGRPSKATTFIPTGADDDGTGEGINIIDTTTANTTNDTTKVTIAQPIESKTRITTGLVQHYRHNASGNNTHFTPASQLLTHPYIHISPVINAQWMCEIRGMAVQTKLSQLQNEIDLIRELILNQINLYQK